MTAAFWGHGAAMSEDQLQAQDTLVGLGMDDVLDEGETIDDRLSQEVPDPSAEADLADHDPSEGDATSDVEPAPASPDDELLT